MSEPIILEHIEWVNDMDPALCDQNLNKDQKALEACVEVANKFNGLKNANNEERYNYPNDKYLANSNVLKDITAALNSKGIESTGIFKNIPPEIRSIQTGGGSTSKYCEVIPDTECIIDPTKKIPKLVIRTSYNPNPNMPNYISIDIAGLLSILLKQEKGADQIPPIGPDDWRKISPNFEIRGWGTYGLQLLFHPDENITVITSEDFYNTYGEGDLIGTFYSDETREFSFVTGR